MSHLFEENMCAMLSFWMVGKPKFNEVDMLDVFYVYINIKAITIQVYTSQK